MHAFLTDKFRADRGEGTSVKMFDTPYLYYFEGAD